MMVVLQQAAIPAALRERPQWLLWRFEQHPGEKKPRKVPYYTSGRRRTGEQGSPADRAALVVFDIAAAALAASDYSGIGFAFLPGDGLIGIDLDGMIDAETGEICDRGADIIQACASYTELSPSGHGVHIIVAGETETFKSNAAGIEVFCGRQFFTFTGRHYAGTPAEVHPIASDVLRRLRATVEQARQGGASAPAARPVESAAAKVESALAYVSPDCGYDDWIRIGMAIHAELGEGGLSVWEAWSAKSEKFPGSRELATHWKSFRPGAVTGATLYGLATAAGWRAPRVVDTRTPAPNKSPGAASAPPEPEWPDPMMPGAARVPAIPCALLPGWVGDMAAAVADSTQTPEAMATMLALSALATVLQRRFEVAPYGEADEYTEPVGLWTLTAMPSGARKTAVINALAAPLMRWEKLERDRLRSEIARVAAARAVALRRIEKLTRDAANADSDDARRRLRDEIQREKEEMPAEIHAPKLFTGDVTAETLQALLVKHGERMAVLTDEAGIFMVMAGLYSGGNASLDVFLQAHAGSPVRVDRAEREAYLERPALSFGLALQPGIMADVASGRRFRDSGLLARFLYAMPESNVGRRDVRRRVPIPEAVRGAYEAGLFALLDNRPMVPGKPRVLPFTDPAREVWLDFAEEIEHAQGESGRLESISDWSSKLPGAAARVAGLIELAEVGLAAESVSQAAAARAVELARLLIPHAQEAFGLLGADVADADAVAILRWARTEGLASFKRHSCQKAMEGRFRNVARLTAAAQRLIERDVLREVKVPNKGAPPSVWYHVNPKALST